MSSPLLTRVYLEGHRHAFASVDKPIGTVALSEKISDLPSQRRLDLVKTEPRGDAGI